MVAPSRARGSKPYPYCGRVRRPRRALTGAWIETPTPNYWSTVPTVAPSRARGSKLRKVRVTFGGAGSRPHGRVDRNGLEKVWRQVIGCRALTGAWIETPQYFTGCSAGVTSRPHGRVDRNPQSPTQVVGDACRALTGAWIETACRERLRHAATVAPSRARGSKRLSEPQISRPTGVAPSRARGSKHIVYTSPPVGLTVAPSRARGSKLQAPCAHQRLSCVAPSRARGSKHELQTPRPCRARRALTGAWIETVVSSDPVAAALVAPSRARGSKQAHRQDATHQHCRALTGAWIETRTRTVDRWTQERRALTGAWIETANCRRRCLVSASRALTGAWIETLMQRLAKVESGVAPSRARGSKRHQDTRRAAHGRRALTGAWIETELTV